MANALQIVRNFYPKVTEVRDATRGMYIEVTKQHSNSAAVKRHDDCALAVACKKTKRGVTGAIISLKTSYIIKGNKAYRYTTPASVAREIVSFDRKAGFEPGEYRLSAPPPSIRLGAHRLDQRATGTGRKVFANLHRTDNVRAKL